VFDGDVWAEFVVPFYVFPFYGHYEVGCDLKQSIWNTQAIQKGMGKLFSDSDKARHEKTTFGSIISPGAIQRRFGDVTF